MGDEDCRTCREDSYCVSVYYLSPALSHNTDCWILDRLNNGEERDCDNAEIVLGKWRSIERLCGMEMYKGKQGMQISEYGVDQTQKTRDCVQ